MAELSGLPNLKAPYPWFGGKSRIAEDVWKRFGDVANFVEPFFGSGAVLLSRPVPFHGIETVNDLNGWLCNFWRALQREPEEVAFYADWPVSECVPQGTMIATPHGSVPVELVCEGMAVYGVSQGKVVSTRVTATTHSKASRFIRIGHLRLTENHPVWTRERGYVPSSELRQNIVAKLHSGLDELDLEMVELKYETKSAEVHDLRPQRASERDHSLCWRLCSTESQIQRASFQGCAWRHDARLLLDSIPDFPGDTSRLLRLGRMHREELGVSGAVLDCEIQGGSVRQSDELDKRRRRLLWICSVLGTPRQVVANATGRQICAGASASDAWKTSFSVSAGEDCGGGKTPVLGGHKGEDCGESKGPRYAPVDRTLGDESPRSAPNSGSSGQDFSDGYQPQAGILHRDGTDLSISDGGGEGFGSQRSLCKPSNPQGLSLQRESLPVSVTVYNFQTETGNYFAEEILVHNCDLHARGDALFYKGMRQADGSILTPAEWCERLRADPEFYDTKSAGWWVWGQCCWIGTGWGPRQLPHLGDAGLGVNRQLPHLGDAGLGVNRQLPHLGNAGRGVNRQLPHLGDAGLGVNRQLPHLGDAGQGVNRKLPHLGNAGLGVNRKLPLVTNDAVGIANRPELFAYLLSLAERMKRVRVCCGDWLRVCGPSPTVKRGLTAVFLDPPYGVADRADCYDATEDRAVAAEVRDWAVEHGNDKRMRIALCGYEGEHKIPDEWEVLEWKAQGGYGSQAKNGNDNYKRERVWFSPHCLRPEKERRLFE